VREKKKFRSYLAKEFLSYEMNIYLDLKKLKGENILVREKFE
jgi:hypothetical protein